MHTGALPPADVTAEPLHLGPSSELSARRALNRCPLGFSKKEPGLSHFGRQAAATKQQKLSPNEPGVARTFFSFYIIIITLTFTFSFTFNAFARRMRL